MGDEAEYLSQKDDLTCLYNQKGYRNKRKQQKDGFYQCTKCKEFKPKSEFYNDIRVPCGIRSKCKKCYHLK